MKKLNYFLIITVLIGSSALGQHRFYESAWVDEQNEMTLLTIVKENGNFWLNGNIGKHKIIESTKSYITVKGKEYPVNIDRESGKLLFKGLEYIPEFKSRKRQFAGRWMNMTKETILDIKLNNGGITWDIIKDGNKPIRFYPKLTETGFTFTFGDQQLFYTIKEGFMVDSNGEKYIHITRI